MPRSSILLARLLFGLFLITATIFSLGYGKIVWTICHIATGIVTFLIFVKNNPTPKEKRRNPENRWTLKHIGELFLFGVLGFAILLMFSTMPELEPEPVVVRK